MTTATREATVVTIHELTGAHRQWTSTHRPDAPGLLRGRAVRKLFGASHGFWQDGGLPSGYGAVIRNLSRDERGGGSTWAAEVVLGHVRIDVNELPDGSTP